MIERRRLSINRSHLTRLVLKTLLFFRAHHSHTFISSSIIWRAEWYYARIENESLTTATITYLFDILSFNILISNTSYIPLQKMSSNELCFRKFFTQMTSTKLILSIAFLSFIISKCRIATSDRVLLSRLSTMTLRTRVEKSRRHAKALHEAWIYQRDINRAFYSRQEREEIYRASCINYYRTRKYRRLKRASILWDENLNENINETKNWIFNFIISYAL